MKKIPVVMLLLLLGHCASAQIKETVVVNFDFDKADLDAGATTKLDSFINKLGKAELISISIGGHCDSKGTNGYNDALSVRRVTSVKTYLENKQTASLNSLSAKGFGKHKLLNSDVTEDESRQNRRVEIVAFIKEPLPIKEATAAEIKKETKSLTTILEDSTIKKGDVISIPNLEFYNHSDILLPNSMPTLQELYDILVKNPNMKISIEGHICCTPFNKNLPLEQQENYNISVIRAKMIYDYLLKNKIDPKRISYKALGNSNPIYPIPERSEEEQTANRRVEIRILDK